jgi:hypothetical protein
MPYRPIDCRESHTVADFPTHLASHVEHLPAELSVRLIDYVLEALA